MIYFDRKDNKITKYNITFDKEKLIELKEEIIDNCSKITNYNYIDTKKPSSSHNFSLKNFKKVKIGIKDNEYYYDNDDKVIYRYIYDKYEYPYLVEIIDGLLLGNAKYLGELFNPSKEKEISFKEQATKLVSEINSEDIEKIVKLEKIKELEKLITDYKANINMKSLYPYYVKALGLIEIKEVATLDNFDNTCSFFESENSFEEVYDRVVELIYSKEIRKNSNKLVLKKEKQ